MRYGRVFARDMKSDFDREAEAEYKARMEAKAFEQRWQAANAESDAFNAKTERARFQPLPRPNYGRTVMKPTAERLAVESPQLNPDLF